MIAFIKQVWADIISNRLNTRLLKHFDWFLLALVLAISLFGVVSIFSATSAATEREASSISEIISEHPITYARLQLLWMGAGLVAMCATMFFSYQLFGKYVDLVYWANILILLAVLTVEIGRGGMTAFFNWGSESATLGRRTIQPSEFGKIAMVIALAKLFSNRKKPINTIRELVPTFLYVLFPLILVIWQPDFGTALVYVAIFVVMLWVTGTNLKVIISVLAVIAFLAVPLWYYLNASSSFRAVRILMWLNPENYPDDARQVISGQIAIGSGGLTGKGVVSMGSFASLGYIPDDHTDFCFAIVCEAFGFIGATALICAFAVLLGRLVWHGMRTEDRFGAYIVYGVMAIFLFHIVENICMILGLLPVTGIPLPFISYGGSNYMTNMMGIGLVMNVVMRSRTVKQSPQQKYTRQL